MSDDESKKLPELEELPEIPDLPEMEEVPELEELPEAPPEVDATPEAGPQPVAEAPVEASDDAPLEALPEAAAASATEPTTGATSETSAPKPAGVDGDQPPLRVLDKAPFLLRRAAIIVLAGCALPWMGHGGGWMASIVAKLLIVGGLYLWYLQVMHNWGPKLTGFLGNMANLSLIPKKKPKEQDEQKARAGQRKRIADNQGLATLEHPFPTPLHLIAGVLVILGVGVLPIFDSGLIDRATDQLDGMRLARAIAELGMLAWAAGTFVHIASYERWGRFSPIFPMMFLAMVFAGLMSLISGFARFSDSGLIGISMVLGGGAVTAGGGLAAYTIIEALMQAKREGDEKRQAAAEARKAQREARKAGRK